MKSKVMAWVLGAAVSAVAATAASAGTLDDVKTKGFVQCGVSQGLPGFSNPDSNNNWTGMDVDFCRAVAAAIFNDPQKVKFSPLNSKERFTALQSGEVDLLSRNTTWTMSRDTSLGLKFAGTMYYDGQGFMVKKSLGVDTATEARWRHGVHRHRHHDGTEPRRLFQGEQHEVSGRGDRRRQRAGEGL